MLMIYQNIVCPDSDVELDLRDSAHSFDAGLITGRLFISDITARRPRIWFVRGHGAAAVWQRVAAPLCGRSVGHLFVRPAGSRR